MSTIDGIHQCVIDVVIRYKNQRQAAGLANKFRKLARNPSVKINIIFVKDDNKS